MLTLRISMPVVLRMFRLSVIMSMFFLLSTWLVQYLYETKSLGGPLTSYVASLFNLSSENTAASWFSSMLLLFASLLAFICFHADSQRTSGQSRLVYGWIVIAFVFLGMSLDEMGSIHENAGKLVSLDVFGDGSWQSVVLLPLVGIFAYMVAFAWRIFKHNARTMTFLVFGAALFLSIPLHEYLEMTMWKATNYAGDWVRPIGFVILEEGSELLAALFFIYAMIVHLRDTHQRSPVLTINVSDREQNIWIWTGAIMLIGGASFFLLIHNDLNADEGIAVNWFPSMLAFTIAILVLLTDTMPKYVAVTFLVISCYFGVNFYAVSHWEPLRALWVTVFAIMTIGLLMFFRYLWMNTISILGLFIYGIGVLPIIISFFVESSVISLLVTFVGVGVIALSKTAIAMVAKKNATL